MDRRTGMLAGLLALPVALLVALPAVAWQFTGALPGRQAEAVWTPHGPHIHRGAKVRITGTTLGQLRPGTWVPVSLSVDNPNSRAVQMKRIRVKIAAIVAPHADAAHPCTRADFAIRQMPRRTLQLPAQRSTELIALGVPPLSGPWLSMVNRPVNQDGCKGVELTLKFKARGLKR